MFQRSFIVFGNNNHIRVSRADFDGSELLNGSEFVLYSMYRSYQIDYIVQMNGPFGFVEYIELGIDPDDLDIRIRYYPSTSIIDCPTHHIIIDDFRTTFESGHAVFTFDLLVNWSFPHEDLFGLELYIRLIDGTDSEHDMIDVFRVENDIVISGELNRLSDGDQVQPDDWLLPSALLNGSGLFLSYEGDGSKVPSNTFFSLQAWSLTQTWPVFLGDGCQVTFSVDLAHFTTGEYSIVIEFQTRPLTIDVETHTFTVCVDSDAVDIIDVHPNNVNWIVGGDIWLGVIATDGNGSGIDPGSVQVKVDLESRFPSSDDWVTFDSIRDDGDGLWEYLVQQRLSEGIYMFQWRLSDIAGNQ